MKTLFTTFIFIVISLFTTNAANAQNYASEQEAYNFCKLYINEGNDAYNAGLFDTAEEYYVKALDCNAECPTKQYMKNKKIYKKISDCRYAIEHDGKTRQQANAETVSAILGTALVVGTVAAVASSSHSTVHHYHHSHHHFRW